MNEEKLNEVGALTEVESKDLTKKKIRNKITLVYYYLIQFAFFILSSLGGLRRPAPRTDRPSPHRFPPISSFRNIG